MTSFRQFIEDHKDEIEALRSLQPPYRAGLRYRQVKELAAANPARRSVPAPPERLWQASRRSSRTR